MTNERLAASRYAEALVKSAKESGRLNEVSLDLDLVARAFFEEKDLMRFFEGPQFTDDDKKGLMAKLFKGHIQEVSLDFLCLLLDKYRISALFLIIEQFKVMKKKEENIADARVVSSFKLSDQLKGRLSDALAALTGKNIRLDMAIDPGIIGGLIISVENKQIDVSIRGRLEDMKKNLLAVRVN